MMKRILLILGVWLLSGSELMAFTLSSSEFAQNGPIPQLYTCQGQNISPPLSWQDPPKGTESYALSLIDVDTQKTLGFTYIHWVLFDINGKSRELKANTEEGKLGLNSRDEVNYHGPCPPHGVGLHHYVFRLYALDIPTMELVQGISWNDIDKSIQNHVLGTAELVGTYQYK